MSGHFLNKTEVRLRGNHLVNFLYVNEVAGSRDRRRRKRTCHTLVTCSMLPTSNWPQYYTTVKSICEVGYINSRITALANALGTVPQFLTRSSVKTRPQLNLATTEKQQ